MSLVRDVPSISRRRRAGLPKGLEPDQVRRLLAACDAPTSDGCLAILTLLVRLCGPSTSRTCRVIERVLAIPPRRFKRRRLTFLTETEIDAPLAAPDRTTRTGDTALFSLAVQKGLRASEVIGTGDGALKYRPGS